MAEETVWQDESGDVFCEEHGPPRMSEGGPRAYPLREVRRWSNPDVHCDWCGRRFKEDDEC